MASTHRTRMRGLFSSGRIALLAAALLALPAAVQAHGAHPRKADRIFVIVLENHSQGSVLGNPNTPFLNELAQRYAVAGQYYGVTHPSLPNYIALTSGSNWFVNDDNPGHRFDHMNLVDQLEQHGISWAAYMDAMPSAGYLGDFYPGPQAKLYASKHNPFVLYEDVRNAPARLAHIKPYGALAADLNGPRPPAFVWISPDQCHDMHGGVPDAVPGHAETPCPFASARDDANDAALKRKADEFVKETVTTIMGSRAWTRRSVIFIIADESDYTPGNAATDGWESTAHCCDSPVFPDGYPFHDDDGKPNARIWHGIGGDYTYGGGLIPAIVVAPAGRHGYVSATPYNHYSLLRTIEEVWGLGYLGYASDANQVHAMTEFLAP